MSFIQRLKDPNFVLRGCHMAWKVWAHEITSAAFDSIWRDFLRDGRNKPDWPTRLGIAYMMVLDWNRAFFADHPKYLKEDQFRKDVKTAYQKTKDDLQMLEGLYLGSDHFDLYLDEIKRVYDVWQSMESIRMTGASKILHFLVPWLFVPWDKAIREFYHSECNHTGHTVGDPDCYLEFMKTCNEIAAALLAKCKCGDYRHLSYLHPAYIARGDIRTIPKMLDECNYMWIQMGKRW